MRGPTLTLALVLVVAGAADAAHAQCGEPGAHLQVLVKGKTAIRRGPGLNYPVSAFVEDGRCMRANDISVDGNWVMVEDTINKSLGWVPTKQLDPASIELLSSQRPRKAAGAVGSGQERGYLTTLRPVGLLSAPKRGAKEKRTLPASARVLGLAITDDRAWVQVRNERNETGWIMTADLEDEHGTLAGLPVADNGLKTGSAITAEDGDRGGATAREPSAGAAPPPPPPPPPPDEGAPAADPETPARAAPARAPADEALSFELHALGMFALPRHALESDGNADLRRYVLSANALGAHVEVLASNLGPLAARVRYGLLLIGGVTPTQNPDDALSGQQHDLALLAGLPFTLGPVELIPEVGYTGQIFAVTPALRTRDEPTFFSHHTHLLTLGARAVYADLAPVRLSAEAHGMLGATGEYPFDLGSAGLTGGWSVGAEGLYALSPDLGVVARWHIRGLRAPYVGPAPIDATITAASLVHLANDFSVGVMLRL